MLEPENYSALTGFVRETTRVALEKYQSFFEWRTADGRDVLMDAGCGPGDVLADVLVPFFGEKCGKIYALDISQDMLDHCKQKNSGIDHMHFHRVNLEDLDSVAEFLRHQEPADHIVLSLLMHWIMDREKGWRNVHDLLKPGGDFLSVHFHSVLTLQMHQHVMENAKWSHFFDDLNKSTPKSTTEDHSEKELLEELASAGFTDLRVELKRNKLTISEENLKQMLLSVHVDIARIPKDRLDEYIMDYIHLAVEKKVVRVVPSEGYEYDYNVYTAFGRRPRE